MKKVALITVFESESNFISSKGLLRHIPAASIILILPVLNTNHIGNLLVNLAILWKMIIENLHKFNTDCCWLWRAKTKLNYDLYKLQLS